MKNQKIIWEYLSQEEQKEFKNKISSAKSPQVKRFLEQMLFLTFDELSSLKEELERR